MAFFKNFQQNLPSVSSLVNTISNAVEDLTTAVGEVGCALTDSVAEQVTSMINGFRPEEEKTAAVEAEDTSKQENAVLPEVSKNTNCQKTRSSLEHRANQISCYNTSVSQEQDQGMNEERMIKHIHGRQQSLSKYQETDNAGDSSLKNHTCDGRISVIKQNTRAGSACQDLESTERCKKIGLGISSNGKNDLKEVRYQEIKENHLKKAEKHIKGKGSKGNDCSGNEYSPKGVLASNRHMTQKSIMKEDIYPALPTNSKDKLHGKIKEQINPAKYCKMKGDIKTKKNEAISAKKGTAKSKDEKYSKIVPEKDNSYMDKDEHCSSSESEDEALGKYHEALSRTHNSRLPLAHSRQKNSTWETRQKYSPLSAEYDGYSSEASIDEGYEEDVPSDSTAVLSPEDMSAQGSSSQLPKPFDPEPEAKYGTLDVTFDYDSQEQKLLVTVTAVTDIPTYNRTGGNSWQVHLVLLPIKKQRAKTSIQRGPCPVFTETFKFNHVESEMIGNYAVRFRLYGVHRMKKEKIVGEKIFYLTKLNLQGKMSLPVILEPSYNHSVSI
ncbi:hypothetical protein HPG69_005541 [Diceros bicornis minor]|uniref:C2 domain-containing protein n=1 Tax=Diceros bicornis minor TaxID=77932 RepID=A0A7J7EMS9_DICBM|nr:hypothetical protein HPG69_005541 [Diceros bicornis minor]